MSILLTLILLYLGITTLYVLGFSILGIRPYSDKRILTHLENKTIAVLIPAYKEDAVIVDTAKKALLQNYPRDKFSVVVIADQLKPATLMQLSELPIKVTPVFLEQSSKAKALNAAMGQLSSFDIVVILDADNVMEENFLVKVNKAYQKGHVAMQGHRVAKNQENAMATLDAVSEEINNRIFRRGHQNAGLSSALIGSGMAFDYSLFKQKMSMIDALGGFDKALELSLLKEHINIHYLEDAIVYDEKVSSEAVFTNQRTRWIAAQIRYGLRSFADASIQLFTKGNLDYFDKSLQFLLPPRLLGIGALMLITLVTVVCQSPFSIYFELLSIGYTAGLLVAVPRSFWNLKTFKSALTLPKTFFLMLKAAFGFKKASKNFLHTPHQAIS